VPALEKDGLTEPGSELPIGVRLAAVSVARLAAPERAFGAAAFPSSDQADDL
jgi:hypothetical protein